MAAVGALLAEWLQVAWWLLGLGLGLGFLAGLWLLELRLLAWWQVRLALVRALPLVLRPECLLSAASLLAVWRLRELALPAQLL